MDGVWVAEPVPGPCALQVALAIDGEGGKDRKLVLLSVNIFVLWDLQWCVRGSPWWLWPSAGQELCLVEGVFLPCYSTQQALDLSG